jgi:hypothetical protein
MSNVQSTKSQGVMKSHFKKMDHHSHKPEALQTKLQVKEFSNFNQQLKRQSGKTHIKLKWWKTLFRWQFNLKE